MLPPRCRPNSPSACPAGLLPPSPDATPRQVLGAVRREDAVWVRTTEGRLEMMGYSHMLQDVPAGAGVRARAQAQV